MTLQEYLQSDGNERFPKVELQAGEFQRVNFFLKGSFYYSHIIIPALSEHFKETGMEFKYIQVNSRPQLWDINPYTGEPKSRTVFHLPDNDTTEPKELKLQRKFAEANEKFVTEWTKNHTALSEDIDQYNEQFTQEYTDFILDCKKKYKLSAEEVSFWLTDKCKNQ